MVDTDVRPAIADPMTTLVAAKFNADKHNYGTALPQYVAAEHALRNLHDDGPQDPAERIEAVRTAQYGKVKALLMVGRTSEAREAAGEALVSGFLAAPSDGTDPRRHALCVLASAKTTSDLGNAWIAFTGARVTA